MATRMCKGCSKQLPEGLRPNRLYCSQGCRREALRKTYVSVGGQNNLSTGTVGAMHELLVCADLLKRGHAVFRSVSQSCQCDLVILYGDTPIRVEVTTGYRRTNGAVMGNRHDPDNYDILAVVFSGGEIHYDPPLESFIPKWVDQVTATLVENQ